MRNSTRHSIVLLVALFYLVSLSHLRGAFIHRIFVGDLGNKPQASEVRKQLISQLKKLKAFNVVFSSKDADLVLSGDAELFVREYYNLYVRAGTSPSNGRPIYGGYVSVELKSSSGETLWSYLATARTGSKDAPHHLSEDIVKHLMDGIGGSKSKETSGKP